MNKRELQRKQTYEKILIAAEKVFSSEGFIKPSIQQIAKEAGAAHGTVFLHFHSQENLILRVIEKLGLSIALKIHESMEQRHSLRDILNAHLSAIEAHESLYSHLIMDLHGLPYEASQTVINTQSIISHHMERVVEELKQSHKVKDVPIHMIFNMWIGLVHYYLMNRQLFSPDQSVIAQHRDELITSFLQLLYKGE